MLCLHAPSQHKAADGPSVWPILARVHARRRACRYQSTQLHVQATWGNGGEGADDTLEGAVVTGLVAGFATDDPVALRITGSTAQVRIIMMMW